MSDRDALRNELDFLLASIDDLERERSAGDVDADDHRRLLDGYTARAARISRLLDGPEVEVTSPETPSAGPRRRPTTGVLGILAVIAVAALASWFVVSSSGQRLPGEQITGLDPRDEVTRLLVAARQTGLADLDAAIAAYDRVLAIESDQPEALAYRGWSRALTARQTDDPAAAGEMLGLGVDDLVAAIEADPTYPDPFCFLGIIQYRFVGDASTARPLIDGCLAADPPGEVRGLVEGLAAELADLSD